MNLYTYLLERGRPADPAIVSRRESATYGDLRTLAEGVACALTQAGVAKGERVGVLGENSVFWVASYLAILKLGAVAVPFPARLNSEKFRGLSALTQCAVYCADTQRLRQYAAEFAAACAVVAPAETTRPERLAASVRLYAPDDRSPAETALIDEATDLASLMFTSGSTGEPNAVKVSHGNIIANTESIIAYLALAADDRMMVVLPFDYCFGLSLLHTHLRVGGSLALNNQSQFAEDALDDLERFACTGFAGVPAVYQYFLRKSSLPRRAFPALRHAQQAGGMLAPALIAEFRAAAPTTRFFVMYGQTEATARLSYLPPDRLDDKPGSIGRGMAGVTLRVLDATGATVAPGQVGEIVASGANIALGYWAPDAAKQSFRDGALFTGDLARVDEDGFVYIAGRQSDFIKPSGHRVSAKEIEDVLAELPEVVEVAVVGIPDPLQGEAAKAYIALTDEAELTIKQITDYCRRRLPAYAIPREIVFLAELPKNASQKVLKHALR